MPKRNIFDLSFSSELKARRQVNVSPQQHFQREQLAELRHLNPVENIDEDIEVVEKTLNGIGMGHNVVT